MPKRDLRQAAKEATEVTPFDRLMTGGLDLTTRLPDQDLENIKLDWSDLQGWGMLQAIPSGLATTPVHMRYWHAFNAFGKRFAAFVEAEPSSSDD